MAIFDAWGADLAYDMTHYGQFLSLTLHWMQSVEPLTRRHGGD